jgi:hypothetical protein
MGRHGVVIDGNGLMMDGGWVGCIDGHRWISGGSLPAFCVSLVRGKGSIASGHQGVGVVGYFVSVSILYLDERRWVLSRLDLFPFQNSRGMGFSRSCCRHWAKQGTHEWFLLLLLSGEEDVLRGWYRACRLPNFYVCLCFGNVHYRYSLSTTTHSQRVSEPSLSWPCESDRANAGFCSPLPG